jgi:syntaxin 7/syntaxin 12/13
MMKLPQASSHQEQRQRKIQRERFTEEFTTSLNNFQAALRHMAEKEKDSVRRARAHSGLGQVGLKNYFDDISRKIDVHSVS